MNPNLELPNKQSRRRERLTPYETVDAFDTLRPLARVPVPAGQGDDFSKGPYVLAFRTEDAWRRAWRTCKEKIAMQCYAGAKLGCSISAAKACGRPVWKASFPFLPAEDEDASKREECEAREMQGCLVSAQDRCFQYAREACDSAYANMRIAAPGAPVDRRFSGEPLPKVRTTWRDKLQPPKAKASRPEAADASGGERPSLGVTNFPGRLLMELEPREEFERMPNWNAEPTQNQTGGQKSFRKEGYVGGLVHPARPPEPEQEATKEAAIPEVPVYTPLDLWNKMQQSVMDRFSEKRE